MEFHLHGEYSRQTIMLVGEGVEGAWPFQLATLCVFLQYVKVFKGD
jgi:hypothetical protein